MTMSCFKLMTILSLSVELFLIITCNNLYKDTKVSTHPFFYSNAMIKKLYCILIDNVIV